MIHPIRWPLAAVAAALLLPGGAHAQTRYKASIPPSAELTYAIKAKQKGVPFDGEAVMRWTVDGRRFTASNEARTILVGKILDARTEGEIDAYGLAPASFTEKRFRKPSSTTTFDRTSGTIRFSASEKSYPLRGGEQDRNSVIWELVGVARAAPARVKPGMFWDFFVAGQRDAESWTFKVVRPEKLRTALGELNTIHITRVQAADAQDHRVDIWLAPALEWYPARVRYTEDDGDYIEQTLRSVGRKTP